MLSIPLAVQDVEPLLDPVVRVDHQYPSLHLWGPAHLITTLEI